VINSAHMFTGFPFITTVDFIFKHIVFKLFFTENALFVCHFCDTRIVWYLYWLSTIFVVVVFSNSADMVFYELLVLKVVDLQTYNIQCVGKTTSKRYFVPILRRKPGADPGFEGGRQSLKVLMVECKSHF